jgi:TRAP-type mannitol/chloroaromatic compound transport system substrate-binding protein
VQARYDARNPAALKTLLSQGTRLMPFSKELMDRAFKEALALYNEIGLRNAHWRKLYADYAGFQRDANLWFRLAEARFDGYMQSARL